MNGLSLESEFEDEEFNEYDFVPLPEQKVLNEHEELTKDELAHFTQKKLVVYYHEDDTHNIELNSEEVNIVRKYYQVPITNDWWTVVFQKIKVNDKTFFVVDFNFEEYLIMNDFQDLLKYIELKQLESWFNVIVKNKRKKTKL